MVGIGKTTLANEVYRDPIALQLFEVRLFFTFGPKYGLRKLLRLALDQLAVETGGETDFKLLGDHLYRRLSGRRYLVVLDDIWNGHLWFQIKHMFPINPIGSRIIITTRLADIAFNVENFQIRFLNDDESWDLLRKMVCSEDESCSLELEKIGRKIAKNIEGLPAAIIEVGKILRKTEKKIESWTEIAEKEDQLLTIGVDEDTPISKAVCLSYDILPQDSKQFLLYMGLFPKKREISPSMLINLWMSEGFFEIYLRIVTLEEQFAKMLLRNLVSRSLALVSKESSSGGIKTCRIHLVYRNLCISEARKEAFFHIVKRYADIFPQSAYSRFWGLCFHNNIVLGFKQVHKSLESVFSGAKSLHCFGPHQQYPIQVYLSFESLRVLNALTIRFYMFPRQVLELVELRFLAITYDGEIPPPISHLCNLEVLIVRRHLQIIKFFSDDAIIMYLRIEIWKMRKLRHLQCMGFDMKDPSKEDGFDGTIILENLTTLLGVSARSLNRGVLERIPKLTKLGIRIEPSHEAVEKIFNCCVDLNYLDCLQSFKCIMSNPRLGSQGIVSLIPAFSDNIIKITLSGCGFSWRDIACIGKLPKLQVLKLRLNAFGGSEWKTNGFRSLEFLLLEDLDIEQWRADVFCFLGLRKLIIRHCYKLREVPFKIGYSASLVVIEVDNCSPSVVLSIHEMHEKLNHLRFKPTELRIKSAYGMI